MNLIPFDIYLVSICGKIVDFAGIAVLACIGAMIISSIAAFVNMLKYGNKHIASVSATYAKRFAAIATIAIATYVLVPSSRTLAAMYVIPAIANSKIVSKDIPEAGKALIEMATEWMRAQTKSIKEAAK